MIPQSINAVGYTCQITAGFRAVELMHNPEPIISDPLAQHLAGSALSQALVDYQELADAQGQGRSLRVPARNRIMDDYLLEALQELKQEGFSGPVQVVNIGCGMDTKPWRLQTQLKVHWFDVDQPAVMQLKQQLLQQAGAAATGCKTSSTQQQHPEHQQQSGVAHFPLLIEQWNALPVDLAVTPLAQCLEAAGFQQNLPTVWIAEALLYYLPLHTACQLLRDMRGLSAPGSKLIATCIDKELQEAHLNLEQEHYFSTANVAWHFCMDDLLGTRGLTRQQAPNAHLDSAQACDTAVVETGACKHHGSADNSGSVQPGSVLEGAGWRVEQQPRTTAQIAQERYNKETYVALYGGAECCFTAVPVYSSLELEF